jgi:hypothetical protein
MDIILYCMLDWSVERSGLSRVGKAATCDRIHPNSSLIYSAPTLSVS